MKWKTVFRNEWEIHVSATWGATVRQYILVSFGSLLLSTSSHSEFVQNQGIPLMDVLVTALYGLMGLWGLFQIVIVTFICGWFFFDRPNGNSKVTT